MPNGSEVSYAVTTKMVARWRAAIASKRIRQNAIARALGVSDATVSDLVNGKISQSVHVPALCEVLGIDWRESLPLADVERRWLRVLRTFAAARSPSGMLELLADLERQADAELVLSDAYGVDVDVDVMIRDRRPQPH